jgi:hypothetical protein
MSVGGFRWVSNGEPNAGPDIECLPGQFTKIPGPLGEELSPTRRGSGASGASEASAPPFV